MTDDTRGPDNDETPPSDDGAHEGSVLLTDEERQAEIDAARER
jgi:hypothetical protein